MLSAITRRCQLHRRSKTLLTHANLRGTPPPRCRIPSGLASLYTSPNLYHTRHENTRNRKRWSRNFSTSKLRRNGSEETETGKKQFTRAFLYKPRSLSEEQAWEVIEQAKEVWPKLQLTGLDASWSSDWAEWDNLFPLYWHSPHYLMIPAIEMFVNLQYGIEGETKPLLYSLPVPEEDWLAMKKKMGKLGQQYLSDTPPDHFFFTINGKEDSEVYMAELNAQTILRVYDEEDKPLGVNGLLDALAKQSMKNVPLPPSEEGCQLLERIFARDPTVTEVLGQDRWLGTVPEATKKWEEWTALPEALTEEDFQNDEIDEKIEKEASKNSAGAEHQELSEEEEKEEKEGGEEDDEPQEIQFSEEERIAVEEARKLGLTDDMDELSQIMEEAEKEIDFTVKRMGELLAEAADPSSLSSSTPSAEYQSSLAAEPLSTDPDAVDRAVDLILENKTSLSHLRGLSVEQLAKVQDRLEAIVAELDRGEEADASAWRSGRDGEMETSQVGEDRTRVRVPFKPSGEDGRSKDGDS